MKIWYNFQDHFRISGELNILYRGLLCWQHSESELWFLIWLELAPHKIPGSASSAVYSITPTDLALESVLSPVYNCSHSCSNCIEILCLQRCWPALCLSLHKMCKINHRGYPCQGMSYLHLCYTARNMLISFFPPSSPSACMLERLYTNFTRLWCFSGPVTVNCHKQSVLMEPLFLHRHAALAGLSSWLLLLKRARNVQIGLSSQQTESWKHPAHCDPIFTGWEST